MASRVSALAKPRRVWWERLGPDERLWVWLVVIWGIAMFVMIAFVWPLVGQEQNRLSSYRVDPAAFAAEAEAFIERYQVGQLDGVPVVAPPPGVTSTWMLVPLLGSRSFSCSAGRRIVSSLARAMSSMAFRW